MNQHKNAKLTVAQRVELVLDITARGVSPPQAAAAYGISAPTARKWLGRYRARGEAGLFDGSCRPARSPRAIEPVKRRSILELRGHQLSHSRIAQLVGVSSATVGRVLARGL